MGERTGKKANPEEIERQMRNARNERNERLFQREEWLIKTQIMGFFHASLHGRELAVRMLHQRNRHLILQQMRMTTSTPSFETDRNNLLDDIQSRIGLEHPIVYETYDLCAYHKEGKLQAFNVAMLKTILRHFEVTFRAKDGKADLIKLLTEVIQECNC